MRATYRLLTVLGLLAACGSPQEFTSPEALHTYLTQHDDFHQIRYTNNVEVAATYCPTDLMVGNAISGRSLSTQEWAAERKTYAPYAYFTLSLRQNQRDWVQHYTQHPHYGQLVNTLSFRMAEYVYLTVGTDTLAPADVYYDRSFGVASATQLLLAFPRDGIRRSTGPVHLHVREFGGGLGALQFQFPLEKIINQPTLTLN